MTPSRASTETVKAVWNGASFLAAIRFRPSSSQRSSVSARQISPRPCVAMKLIASGVANCAAMRQIALVLAVLVVADDDHPPAADVLDRLLDRRERASRSSSRSLVCSVSLATRSPPIRVTGATRHQAVDACSGPGRRTSTFTRSPASTPPSVVRSSVSGISETSSASPVERGDGEADALDRDRAVLDDVAAAAPPAARRAGAARSRRRRRSATVAGRRRRGPARCGRRGGRRPAAASSRLTGSRPRARRASSAPGSGA